MQLFAVCAAVILRKQWVEHERLVFPLAEASVQVARDSARPELFTPPLRSKAFWVGVAIPGTFLSRSPEERLMAKIAHRFEGKTDWEIKIPKSRLRFRTSITLHFRNPDGLVMYDKMSLKLSY